MTVCTDLLTASFYLMKSPAESPPRELKIPQSEMLFKLFRSLNI